MATNKKKKNSRRTAILRDDTRSSRAKKSAQPRRRAGEAQPRAKARAAAAKTRLDGQPAIAKLQDELAAQTRRLNAERRRAKRLSEDCSVRDSQIKVVQEAFKELENRYLGTSARLDDEIRRVQHLTAELSSRDAHVLQLEGAISASERKQEVSAASLSSTSSALQDLQHKNAKVTKRLDELTLRLKAERKKSRVLEWELGQARSRVNVHQQAIAALRSANDEAQANLVAIRASTTWKVVSTIAALRRHLSFRRAGAPEAPGPHADPPSAAASGALLPKASPGAVGADQTTSIVQRSAWTSTTRRKLPLTALVITWDIGHNPVGRSYMLAEVIDRVVRHTVVVGFQFPRYGTAIWEPLRSSRLPVIRIPGKALPEFAAQVEHLARVIRPDIVFACKPRLPSLQLGLRIKEISGCPLILDIDDHELAFFDDQKSLTLDDVESIAPSALQNETEPYGKIWTRLSESLVGSADVILVSNGALQQRFGGEVIPHVRDETAFDRSAIHDRAAIRRRLGIPVGAKVVLFFGTPRKHKGITALVDAVSRIDDPDFRLVVVGMASDRSITTMLDQAAPGQVIQLPNQPFSAIPEVLACADAVALPQDLHHPVSRFQLPAKAIDAVAMGVPLLVSQTPPLMELVRHGVAMPLGDRELAAELEEAVRQGVTPHQIETRRARFLERYSYAAAAEQIRAIVEKATRSARKSDVRGIGSRLVDVQRRTFGFSLSDDRRPEESGRNVVVFWKQNDTTLYGRRHDMVIKYLASRSDTRRVLVFDMPISIHKLIELRDHADHRAQHRHVYVRTEEKRLGLRDQGKIRYRVFAYQPGVYSYHDEPSDKPSLSDAYLDFIRETLQAQGIEASKAVFWFYPKNDFIARIVKTFEPARTVMDVVDDHRAWPNVSEQEAARLTRHYREVLSLSNVAMVNCEPLRESMRQFCPSIELIPNGCDTEPESMEPNDSPEFERLKAWRGKVIGFTGNLESKIDLELLDRVATEFPDCLLALVGSTHMNPAVNALDRHANVLMPGVVPYDYVGAWIQRFDVAIIPHLRSELTKNMNPLKLFVYATHGVPVISTNVQNLDEALDLLLIARSAEDFIEKLRAVLSGKIRFRSARDYGQKNSWGSRFKRVVDRIFECSNGRSTSDSVGMMERSARGPSE